MYSIISISMPPYIFNCINESSMFFFNKTRFCSLPRKTTSWITLVGSVAIGSTLSYYLYSKSNVSNVSNVSWLSLRNTLSKWTNGWTKVIDDKPVNKNQHYENKYYDEYDNLECCELEEDYVKSLRNNILFETTPKGGIALYYDFEKESFVYYCDTKDIPYLFLETASRKYAVIFHCKKIVVDMKNELMLAKEQKTNVNANANNSEHKIGDKTDGEGNDLFATFKSYNKKGSGGSRLVDDNKKFVLRQQANRYSYAGKFDQYSPLKTDEYKTEKPMDNMNYHTFKKLMAKKN